MPRNPSEKQRNASRRNLAGHHGPKTASGKKKVAENGRCNKKGTKTAKARARIIGGRWDVTNTFYSYAGCLYCDRDCLKRSFSSKTLLSALPLYCLKGVLTARPERCFYYFEGICCIDVAGTKAPRSRKDICILDGEQILAIYQSGTNLDVRQLQQRELRDRLKSISRKKEMARYLSQVRNSLGKNLSFTPRMKHVVRYYQSIVKNNKFCRFEPSRKYRSDLDKFLLLLLDQNL